VETEAITLRHPLARGTTVARAELWTFPEGLIGLPALKSLALVPLDGAEPFELLCAADDSGFGLVVVDPRVLVADYVLPLGTDDLAPLADPDPERVQIRVPVVLPSEGAPLYLNLKGPILLAAGERVGLQRVSRDESHPLRFAPSASGAAPCSS
jgi:flagellar assembly factor FliW